MKTVNLFRVRTSDHGTEGMVFADTYQCFSIEPPCRNNEPNYSCVPAGTYKVKIRRSPKFGLVFHLTDVQGRTFILIHSGNWAGDRRKGLRSDTYGCLLFGLKRGVMAGQRAVLNSRTAVRRFMEAMGSDQFTLNIYEAWKEA